jgi:hypothetical protein
MAKRKRHRSAATASRRRRRPVSANPKRRRRKHALFSSAARKRVGLNPRRRRRHHAANPARRRRYRRNPGLMGGGVKDIGALLVQGVKDGFVVRLGGGLSKYVATKIPVGTAGSPTQGAVQLVVGAGLAMAVKKFMGPRAAAFFLAGATADIIGGLIPNTIPVVGPILGAGALSAYPRMGAYMPRALPGVSSYVAAPAPQLQGWDDYDSNLSDGIFS